MKKFNRMALVRNIIALSPRQLEGEKKTLRFLQTFLKERNIPFFTHLFHVAIPQTQRAVLFADGKKVPCDACSMRSGKIRNNYKIISSLVSSRVLQEEPNINFNPRCVGISKSNHYFAPSVAVSRKGLLQVLKAKRVEGEVKVNKVLHTATDILVGNIENPKYVCFAHYDSVETGAIDNASGVAAMMGVILAHSTLLKSTLFVFASNEELSYDTPVYWGHGFRVFEKEYQRQLERANKIIVIDSVGNAKTQKITDMHDIMLGFPINNAKRWHKKIVFLSGDFDHLMTVYHSRLDDGRGMSEKWLKDAQAAIAKELKTP